MKDVVLVKYGESIPSNGPNGIPGYDLLLLVGVIGLISAIIIKKRYRSTVAYTNNFN